MKFCIYAYCSILFFVRKVENEKSCAVTPKKTPIIFLIGERV